MDLNVNRKMNLKILVDKKKNRVVFAESGPEFVDVLLSFLTLPMGVIMKLTTNDVKKSNTGCMDGLCESIRNIIKLTSEDEAKIGCMDELYKSVEELDVQYLQTEACKTMLLSPEYDAQRRCQNLALKIDDDDQHRYVYKCPDWTCSTLTHCLISMFKYSTCFCGKQMDRKTVLTKLQVSEVFVKETTSKFMISDDLNIIPFSITNYLLLLSRLGMNDPKDVEECNISVGSQEVLQLLKQSLVSKTPMKDVFFKEEKQPMQELLKDLILKKQKEYCMASLKSEPFNISNWDSENITIKLLVDKSNNKVLYAEANEDFVDLLFSFLTFPLASIFKLLDASFSIGSVGNMYKSAESLNIGNVLEEDAKEFLLAAKIKFPYGIENQSLNIREAKPWTVKCLQCSICFAKNIPSCSHGLGTINKRVINPKFMNTVTNSGGGYVKGPCTFMVTDDLQVKPFSPLRCTSVVCNLGVPFSDLEEKEAIVGEYEALSLLRASMTSNKVLTEVFCQKKVEGPKVEDID